MMKFILLLSATVSSLLLVALSGCAAGPASGTSSPAALFDKVRFQDEGSPRKDPVALSRSFGSDSKSPARPSFDRPGSQMKPDNVVNQAQVIKQVLITGNQTLAEHEIKRLVRTRPGRYFDPDLLQQDVNELWKMKQIRRVNGPYIDRQADGIVVTIDVTERPFIDKVQYIGNRAITDRQLASETGLTDGQPLDLHAVKMAKTRIEDHYAEKGYPKTQVSIVEGDEPGDRKVVFMIHEDHLQRVWNVAFEGNQIASSSRLKSFIKVKRGLVPFIGGKVNRRELEQDKLRLESYYRSLGFFNARIGREIEESDSGKWLTIRYTINEGPRYRIRSVAFVGNEKYSSADLGNVVRLKPVDGEVPEFNAAKMNEDVTRLQDLYGSEGYVFAKVQAEPRFLETPGELDLVYSIAEGKQYRVGEINVVIDGEYGVTRRQVILNRLGLRPGDLLDTRKMRDAEARLVRSQLFADGSPNSPGNPPRVVVKPPELDSLSGGSQRR